MSIVPDFTRDVFANIKQGARDATLILLNVVRDSVDDVADRFDDDAEPTGEVVANDTTATSIHIAVNDDEVVVQISVG